MMGCEGGGDMMAMMSKMMEGCGPQMITDKMPQCVGMMVQKVPKKKRTPFVLKVVTTLMKEGAAGMSEKEKKEFLTKVAEKVKARCKKGASRRRG